MASENELITTIIPSVGMEGYFTLKAPFSNKLIANEKYTCMAVRYIGDYLANNEDVYTTVYAENGLSQADYDKDVLANVLIVSLKSVTGQWIYLPNTYMLGFPVTNGIQYHNVMIGISLGALPTTKDLTGLLAELKDQVYDNLGIEAELKVVQMSKPILVNYTNHTQIEQVRNTRKTLALSKSAQIKSLQNRVDSLNTLKQALEAEIIKLKTSPQVPVA